MIQVEILFIILFWECTSEIRVIKYMTFKHIRYSVVDVPLLNSHALQSRVFEISLLGIHTV